MVPLSLTCVFCLSSLAMEMILVSPFPSSLLFVAFLGWWLVCAGQHFYFLTFGGVSQENIEPVPLVIIPQSRALKIQIKL